MKQKQAKKYFAQIVGAAALLSIAHSALAYELPIGIPAPEFGIEDTHEMYAGQFYLAGGFDYRDAGNGPYTHYVDNSAENCDDSNAGGYGTEQEPLCNITRFGDFASLPAGSVMEIHGGPYTFNPGWTRMTLDGNEDNPVFVRGVNNGEQQVQLVRNLTGNTDRTQIRLEGQYYIFENLDLYRGVFPSIQDEFIDNPHHIAFRNLEVHGDEINQVGSGVGLSSGKANDVVIYNNHIHHNIRLDNADLHGTAAAAGSERVWILNNEIHHNSGDAFQACHLCSVDNGSTPPRFVYIGGNTMYADRENGVDLKTIRDVVVSQNRIYDYGSSGTSNGDAIVVGSNGASLTLDGIGPDNAWFLFNEISDSGTGVRFEGVFNSTFIGNYIHDNDRNGIALDIKANSRSVRLINNTIANNNEGLHQHWQCHDPLQVDVSNNIFYNHLYFQIGVGGCIAERTTLNNNLFWQGTDPIYFANGYNTYNSVSGPRTPAEALATANERRFAANGDIVSVLNANNLNFTGTGNFAADPRFVNDEGIDLQADSPAIAQTGEHPAYQQFETLYGLDIRYDFNGNKRSINGVWDIGAVEYQDETNSFDPAKLQVKIKYPTKQETYIHGEAVTAIQFGGHASYEDEAITVDWVLAQCETDCVEELADGVGEAQVVGSTQTSRVVDFPQNNWHVDEQALFPGRNVLIITAVHPNGEKKVTSLLIEPEVPLVVDEQAPVIAVSNATDATSNIITRPNRETFTLSGEVSDNIALNNMTWSCLSGCSGNGAVNIAQGATDSVWELSLDNLQYGLNRIILTLDDVNGNAASLTVSIQVNDTAAPEISVTMVSLSGSATDNIAVESVTWSCQSGCLGDGSAVVSGANWQANQVPLVSGANVIRLEALDAAGNLATQELLITQ